jgi:N-acetylmuramoyl-L-alanine amidase
MCRGFCAVAFVLLCLAGLLLLQTSCKREQQNAPVNQPQQKTEEKQRAPQEPAVVCIDPGHPSELNSGKTVQNGTTEVHIAWVVALKLKRILEEKGVRVVMTKASEEQFVMNKERALIANRAGARVMVRLHCDTGESEGFAIYSPDKQGEKDGVKGPSDEVMESSRRAALAIHEEMRAQLEGALKDGGARGDSETAVGSKQGALTGSIFSQVPVATIEMAVLSNERDAEFIKSEEGQQRMALAIASGILRFIGE